MGDCLILQTLHFRRGPSDRFGGAHLFRRPKKLSTASEVHSMTEDDDMQRGLQRQAKTVHCGWGRPWGPAATEPHCFVVSSTKPLRVGRSNTDCKSAGTNPATRSSLAGSCGQTLRGGTASRLGRRPVPVTGDGRLAGAGECRKAVGSFTPVRMGSAPSIFRRKSLVGCCSEGATLGSSGRCEWQLVRAGGKHSEPGRPWAFRGGGGIAGSARRRASRGRAGGRDSQSVAPRRSAVSLAPEVTLPRRASAVTSPQRVRRYLPAPRSGASGSWAGRYTGKGIPKHALSDLVRVGLMRRPGAGT